MWARTCGGTTTTRPLPLFGVSTPVALPVGDTSRDGDDLGAVADVAVSWLESRVHIKGVADLLGHSSISVTGTSKAHQHNTAGAKVDGVEGDCKRLVNALATPVKLLLKPANTVEAYGSQEATVHESFKFESCRGMKSWPPLRRSSAKSCATTPSSYEKLAYTLPNGVGEHDLLWLSERMRTAANEALHKRA